MSPRYSEDIDLVLFTPTQTGRSATDRVVRNLAREAAEAANPDPGPHREASPPSTSRTAQRAQNGLHHGPPRPPRPRPPPHRQPCRRPSWAATPPPSPPTQNSAASPSPHSASPPPTNSAPYTASPPKTGSRLHDRPRTSCRHDRRQSPPNSLCRTVPLLAHDAATARTRSAPGPEAGYATSPALTEPQPATNTATTTRHGLRTPPRLPTSTPSRPHPRPARTLDPPAPALTAAAETTADNCTACTQASAPPTRGPSQRPHCADRVPVAAAGRRTGCSARRRRRTAARSSLAAGAAEPAAAEATVPLASGLAAGPPGGRRPPQRRTRAPLVAAPPPPRSGARP